MDWWGLDREVFRAIHLGLRAAWLDPIMAFLSFTGVGIVHVGALLCSSVKSKRVAFWIILALVTTAVGVVGAKTGDQWIEWAVFGLLLGVFWKLDERIAVEAIAAFLISGGFHLILKAVSQRERPSNFHWASPMEHVYSTHSFPSGHATTAVAIGMILYLSLSNRWLAGAALAWGFLVALSRVYVGVHWPSDVLAAAGLGVASAAAVKLASMRLAPSTIEP